MINTRLAVLYTVFFFIFYSANAQLNETFSDGNFTNNPTWSGGTSDFVISPDLQLQSNNLVANSTYYLSAPNTLATMAQWEMYVKIDFNPSSANYIDVFLTASATDISNNATTGYFVRIGNTDDEISLYRKDANVAGVKIIDGANGILNNSTNVMKIKVIRSTGNQWTLYRDLTATGNNYVAEGVVTDATFTTSAYFGFLVKQSTSSFFQKHFFDDITIQPYSPDVTPPAIQSATAISPNSIDVMFNEPVDATSAQVATNYTVNNNVGNPATATRDASNPALVHLTFTNNFPNGQTNTVTVNGVKDLAGNAAANATATFSYYVAKQFDVVIDEIFADPTPVISLPDQEFIEIKNTSGRTLNLQGWKLTTPSTTSGLFTSYTLPADSFLILTSTAAAPLFTKYGRVLGVASFPSLANDGTTLSIISKEGATVHSVSYTSSWYQNSVKQDGGWTLEMIDTKNACTGADNWKASTDLRGGTPGTKNSIDANNPDQSAPALLRAAAIDGVTLLLTFSEAIDSTKGATGANYTISDGVTVTNAVTIAPAFNKVQLTVNTPLVKGKVYIITASNVSDCSGNTVQAARTVKVGLPSVIDSLGIIINELLYNPKPGGVDFIEIYNRSNNVYDLKDLYLANRSSSTNQIATKVQLSTDNRLIFPGDYALITTDPSLIQQQYTTKTTDNFVQLSSLPSYPDDKGVVVLLNAQGTIVDELRYDEKWQFELLDNTEGVSLERIDYNKTTQDKNNWHSAASTAGYGTPGYQNSQFRNDLQVQGEVTVTPKTFSPDNDGMDDFAVINYQLADLGYVANITIFDAAGRPIKALAKNATLSQKGSFRWDGLDDKLRKVPVGVYVIYTEMFNLSGKKKTFKTPVIVAARF